MKAKKGMKVCFSYNGKNYTREITDITVYKNYSWIGDIGWDGSTSFLVHGALNEKYVPVMEFLAVQVDTDFSHEYVRENVTFHE